MTNILEDNCILCKRKTDCFKRLTEDELKKFNESKTTIRYRKGETIIKQGTEFTHIISFNEGLAKINIEVSPNKNILIGILKASEILGGPGMFVDNKYSFTVSAITDCSICLINIDIFKKILRTNDEFAEDFLSTFSSRFTQSITRLVNITQKQMHGRLAEAILYFSDSIYNSDKFEMAISRQELAEFTGMSKESISRILHQFSEDNIVKTSGRLFEIKDKEKLYYFRKTG